MTGSEIASYTYELASRLQSYVDLRVLKTKSYGPHGWQQLYGFLDLPVHVRREVRHASIVHLDSQRLANAFALKLPNPTLVTCNDILPLEDLYRDASYDLRSPSLRKLQRGLLACGLRRANTVVTPSEFTKKELIRLLPKLQDKIVTIPWAVDTERFRPRDQVTSRSHLNLPRNSRIVLVIGTESPRKNLETLLRAFARVASQADAVLLKIGPARQPIHSNLTSLARSLGIHDKAIFVEHATTEELPLYYAAADVFVQPSLYEGFGIPPLEAMACGVPVASSKVASLPEVLDDSAMFVDPMNDRELADAIIEILSRRELAEDLRTRGLRRAARFPWDSCVAAYVSTYHKIDDEAD